VKIFKFKFNGKIDKLEVIIDKKYNSCIINVLDKLNVFYDQIVLNNNISDINSSNYINIALNTGNAILTYTNDFFITSIHLDSFVKIGKQQFIQILNLEFKLNKLNDII
jgi:malic enzyme